MLYLVVVAVPLVVLVMRPGDPIAFAQLVVATLAVLLGALWGLAWPQLWTGLGLALTVGLWPGSANRVRCGGIVRIRSLPCSRSWGCRQHCLWRALARNTTEVEDITNGVSHYPMQASLALAVVGLVALAALTRSRLPAWTAGFSACWLGLVPSSIRPERQPRSVRWCTHRSMGCDRRRVRRTPAVGPRAPTQQPPSRAPRGVFPRPGVVLDEHSWPENR